MTEHIEKTILETLDTNLEKISANRDAKRPDKKKWNSASSAGWVQDCIRRLVLLRLCPEKEEPKTIEDLRRLEEGNRQEVLMREEMIQSGFNLKRADRMENKDLQLTGEVEDLLSVNGDTFPLDFKSCSTYMFKKIRKCNSALELANANEVWVRHYPSQMLLYDYMYGHDCGLLFFKDKDRGEKHIVPVPVDKTYTQEIIYGLEQVNEYVAKGKAPKAKYIDDCRWCGFCNTVCFPGDEKPTKDVVKISDAELELKLKRREELKSLSKEYDALDKDVKDQLRGSNCIVGEFQVSSTDYEATIFKVPKEVKEEYKDTMTRVRMTIRDLGGSL